MRQAGPCTILSDTIRITPKVVGLHSKLRPAPVSIAEVRIHHTNFFSLFLDLDPFHDPLDGISSRSPSHNALED